MKKQCLSFTQSWGIPELVSERRLPQAKKAEPSAETKNSAEGKAEGFLSDAVREQLKGVFAKFSQPVMLKAWLNEEPLSGEITGFFAGIRRNDGYADFGKKQKMRKTQKAAFCHLLKCVILTV